MYKFEVLLKDVEGVESWYTFHDVKCSTPELAIARAMQMYPGMRIRVRGVQELKKHAASEMVHNDA